MYLMGGVGMLIKDYNEAVLVAGAAMCLVAAACHVMHVMLAQRGRV